MEYLIFWVAFSIVVWVMAANRNRSGVGWFLLSLIISPIISILLLLVFGKLATEEEIKEVDDVKADFIQLYCENEDFASKNPNFKRLFEDVSNNKDGITIAQLKDAINIIATEAASAKKSVSDMDVSDEEMDNLSKIEKLASLKEKGLITDAEFEEKRKKLLASI